jgi:hypothetical protein
MLSVSKPQFSIISLSRLQEKYKLAGRGAALKFAHWWVAHQPPAGGASTLSQGSINALSLPAR